MLCALLTCLQRCRLHGQENVISIVTTTRKEAKSLYCDLHWNTTDALLRRLEWNVG